MNIYYGKECIKCKRKHLINTKLNIEGHIHHRCNLECIDKKSCRRTQRKNKRKHHDRSSMLGINN
jgi:hypothetical protein